MYARSRFRRLCHGVSFSPSWCEPWSRMLGTVDPAPLGCADVHGVSHPGVRVCASVNGAFVGGMSMRSRLRLLRRGAAPLSDPSGSVSRAVAVCWLDGLPPPSSSSSSSSSCERRSMDAVSHGMDIAREPSRGRRVGRCELGDRGIEPESVGRWRANVHHRDGPGSSGAEDWKDAASDGRFGEGRCLAL